VWTMNSRIALLFYTRGAGLGAELAALRMGILSAALRKTWRAIFAFIVSRFVSVRTRAVCSIVLSQAWAVASLLGRHFKIVVLVADSAA
jgi:hypothetical protein